MTPATRDLTSLAVWAAAEVAVYRALVYAGRRMLRDIPRGDRGRLAAAAALPQHELHLHLSMRPGAAEVYMCDDAWYALGAVVERPEVVAACEQYVRDLLRHRMPHTPDYLRTALCQIGQCP